MATLPTTEPAQSSDQAGIPANFAICLPSMPADALQNVLRQLREVSLTEQLLIASPDQSEEEAFEDGALRLVPYPVQRNASDWVLNAEDYLAAGRLVQQRNLGGALLLGTDAASLGAEAVRSLLSAMQGNVDLVVPRYQIGSHQGLVNSALLYPVTRALFGLDVRFPLPLDVALSQRMLTRLGSQATRAANDGGFVWPVAEAALSGFIVRQVDGITRSLPRPQESDLNVLLPAVASSLFADVESKAAYWQRARPLTTGSLSAAPGGALAEGADPEEIRSLVEGFRLAFSNLREIWSLVLPPQTLLSLKRASQTAPESFSFPAGLWARVVYDFAIAFHLRTLNRGHLLGAMTPLYLAWVASLLRETSGAAIGDVHVEATARAFEQEKPYFVSRWRWPDRFNP